MPAQLALVAVGIWLMAAPDVLGHAETASDSARTAGPVMASIAFLGVFTITRGLRWLNLLTGLWLVAAPWVLGLSGTATANSLVCGVAALLLAPVGSVDQDRYAGGWRALLG